MQGSKMLQKKMANELVYSRLNNNYMEREVECMMHAAHLCISPYPEQWPMMFQILYSLNFLTNYILKIFSTDICNFWPTTSYQALFDE